MFLGPTFLTLYSIRICLRANKDKTAQYCVNAIGALRRVRYTNKLHLTTLRHQDPRAVQEIHAVSCSLRFTVEEASPHPVARFVSYKLKRANGGYAKLQKTLVSIVLTAVMNDANDNWSRIKSNFTIEENKRAELATAAH